MRRVCGTLILSTTSSLAGCKHSVALTRRLMFTGITSIAIYHALALPKVYVDATAPLPAGSPINAMESMLLSVMVVVDLVQDPHLILSIKGVIVAKMRTMILL